jgi:hypothetical protein
MLQRTKNLQHRLQALQRYDKDWRIKRRLGAKITCKFGVMWYNDI